MSVQFKTLIFFGLLAMALGFTLPEDEFEGAHVEPEWVYGDGTPVEEHYVLVRRARSPQGRLDTRLSQSSQHGKSASVDYTHPINKNWEAYAQASRNFKYNDNSAHAGLRFKF